MEPRPANSPPLSDVPVMDVDRRLALVLESIEEGFCAFDNEWRFSYVNGEAQRMLGSHLVVTEPLVGRQLWQSAPGVLGTKIEAEFHRVVEERVPVAFEYLCDSQHRWYSIRCFPGEQGGLAVYFRDVTAEKQRAHSASQTETRYHSLIDSIGEGFCIIEMVWDAEGKPVDYRFIQVNAAFEEHTGLRDAAGKTVREMNPMHETHWFELYGKVARTGERVHFIQSSESLGRWFEVVAFRLGDGAGAEVGVRFRDVSKQRRVEEELARVSSESRSRVSELETLLDVLPIGIGIALERDCRNIRMNAAFADVLGLPPSVNASKTAAEQERPNNFLVVDDLGREIKGEDLPLQVAAREGREVRDVELNIVHTDGRVVRLLEYAAPLFDEQGVPRGSIGAFVDITERRQAEERQRFLVMLDDAVRPLSNAEEIVATSARLLGEHLRVDRCAYADVEADEDTMHITGDYNCGVPSIVGRFTFTEFGKEVLRLMRANAPYVVADIETHQPPPEDLSAYYATLIRAVVCVPLHKDGKFVAAMAVHMKTVRRWKPDEVALILHVANRCWEALERARVTRVLKESENRFRTMADLMPQVVWLARPDGVTDYYNRRWCEFSGQAEGDADFMAVLHPEDRERCAEQWQHCVRTGDPYEIRYRWHDRASGGYRWFLGRALPLRNERGEIVRWYGTSTDIDDLVRADEAARHARGEAERANRAKDEFLAALSHELRTPLTPVLMAAESLCDDPSVPKAMHETLCMMQRNIAMEARLIDDLLDLTRISHGKFVLRLHEGEVHSLLGLALEIVRDDAQAKGLEISTDLQADRTHLRCDSGRLQQVFWNLLKNAVKFTPPRGQIGVRSWNEGNRVVLEVTDSGMGLRPETLERIFLPFEQAGLANDHRYGGLGLGLSISKAIVEMHGGTIAAMSPGLDQGATFRVTLPTAAPSQPAEGGSANPIEVSSRDGTSTARLRLLVVEDHEPTLTMLARLLKRSGHSVATVGTVADAKDTAARHPFDLIISDIGLPDGSGIELMRILHQRHGLNGIALTGYGTEEDMRLAQEAGFLVHLTKPVEFAQLRRALAQFPVRTREAGDDEGASAKK